MEDMSVISENIFIYKHVTLYTLENPSWKFTVNNYDTIRGGSFIEIGDVTKYGVKLIA
jgi:hypothetical protein